MKMKVRYL